MSTHQLWHEATGPAYRAFLLERDAAVGSFLSFAAERQAESAGPLHGLPFGVKDNIAVAGLPLTCGSRFLAELHSPYSATAVERLIAAGAVVAGKTNLDEFGMGSSTEHSAVGKTVNPWDEERVAGGSSGGSAAAVAAGLVPFALGSDTGGSVRQPASFCGVYGLKPSYGSVSRHGLTAYASSLDVIGVLSVQPRLALAVFRAMSGADPFDQTSLDVPVGAAPESAKTAGRRIALLDLSGAGDSTPAEPIRDAYARVAAALRDLGHRTEAVSLDSLEYSVAAYYTIATAEAAANLARFTGIRYGRRPDYAENPEELVRKARTEGFGPEVKLRILLGTYVLRSGFQDQYYVRAQKVRTLLRRELDGLFARFDAILLPTYPTLAFRSGSRDLTPMQEKLGDRYTTTANLAGLPALAFPAGLAEGLPVGLQLMGPAFSEATLVDLAAELAVVFPPEAPPAYPPRYHLDDRFSEREARA